MKGKACKGLKEGEGAIHGCFICYHSKQERKAYSDNNGYQKILKKFDKGHLPVDYYSQKEAWMEEEIMELVLAKLNRRLSRMGRYILLLMDNAGCHQEHLQG